MRMVITLLPIILAVVLLIGFLYAFFGGNRSRRKKPLHGAGRPEPKKSTRLSTKDPSPPGDIPQPVDTIAFPAPGGTDETTLTLQVWVRDGIARAFSGEAVPQESTAPPLKIKDVRDDVRERVMSHIATLKNFQAVQQLQRMMGDPRTTMTDLSRMIVSNPLLSAKILQVANSAYYGMEQKLNSISHAIMIIGVANLKAIIYHEGILQVLKEKNFGDNPAMQTIWKHASYTSIYASYLHCLFDGLNMGALFTIGLLHDIGKFIMMKLPPVLQAEGEPPVDYSPTWTVKEEEKIYGINHALVGRLALQHWGLPRLIVDTVTLHHAPMQLTPDDLKLDRETLQSLLVLFLANQAARLSAGMGGDVRMESLHPSHHCLIDRNKLAQVIVDKSLMSQLREAEAITGVYT